MAANIPSSIPNDEYSIHLNAFYTFMRAFVHNQNNMLQYTISNLDYIKRTLNTVGNYFPGRLDGIADVSINTQMIHESIAAADETLLGVEGLREKIIELKNIFSAITNSKSIPELLKIIFDSLSIENYAKIIYIDKTLDDELKMEIDSLTIYFLFIMATGITQNIKDHCKIASKPVIEVVSEYRFLRVRFIPPGDTEVSTEFVSDFKGFVDGVGTFFDKIISEYNITQSENGYDMEIILN